MNELPDRAAIEDAARVVHAAMSPTAQRVWPQLSSAVGAEVWLKHENLAPTGAFKLRGGLVYVDRLMRREPRLSGIIGATRGNHGQSIAFAARRHGLRCTVVIPRGNSRTKNAAMRALGAEIIEYGDDFQASREHAALIAAAGNLHFVPSFHLDLVAGVATYWSELFAAAPDLDVVYVPIGQGSGACAAAAARNALSPRTRIVGVVSTHAPCYARSFAAGHAVDAPATTRLADGLACRTPDPESLTIIRREVDRIVEVTDDEVAAAMRLLFDSTQNVAEGAGAAALAAALQEKPSTRGKRIGLTLSGGNVDADLFGAVLSNSHREWCAAV
jgi:threonine dehydratase